MRVPEGEGNFNPIKGLGPEIRQGLSRVMGWIRLESTPNGVDNSQAVGSVADIDCSKDSVAVTGSPDDSCRIF